GCAAATRPVMSLTATLAPFIILSDDHAQESGVGTAGHGRAALPPRRAGGRLAAGGRAAARGAGRAAPQLWEGGVPVHTWRAGRPVCVPAGRRATDVRAGGAGGGGPRPRGGLRAAAQPAAADLGDQPGTAVTAGTGLGGAPRLRAGAVVPGGRCRVGGD